jgi:hypothetical protein
VPSETKVGPVAKRLGEATVRMLGYNGSIPGPPSCSPAMLIAMLCRREGTSPRTDPTRTRDEPRPTEVPMPHEPLITTDPTESQRPQTRSSLAHRWPTAAGIALAAFVGFGTTGHGDVAPVVTASGFVYLGAAALRRRTAAWPMFFISFVLITIGFSIPGFAPSWSSWSMLGIAAALVAYGLARGAMRPPWGVPLQAGAMVVLAAAAITAVNVGATWAGLLVSAALLAHTAWDVYHHRVERVVARSMAEFCAVLDTLLAFVVLAVTLTS